MRLDSVDGSCVYYGKTLTLPVGIDGVALMQAIADVESTYGANAVPRHEKVYDWGGRYCEPIQLRMWGSWAACSYGPWQVMWSNIVAAGIPATPMLAHTDASVTANAAAWLINHRIVPSLPAGGDIEQAVRAIGDAYNSGSCKDDNYPSAYMGKLWSAYQLRKAQRSGPPH